MTVVKMPERQGVRQARQLESSRALARDVAQIIFGYAYAIVLADYPDVETPKERYDLALTLAFAAGPEVTRQLDAVIPYTNLSKMA